MTSIKYLYNFLIMAVAAILTSACWQTGCNTIDPPLALELKLELEDISCTEAWITLTTNNIQLPAEINLVRTDAFGNSVSQISMLNTKDSLLYIDSLLPKQTYKLKASSIQNPVSSNELSVTTLDTTSHNFTFETWTFGTIGSSTLYDVAIINENNIWAVGEIYVADTSANGYTTYNAVHWEGNEWTLKRITVSFRGNLITPPLEGVFAFSSNDIWFVGSLPIYGDGENWVMYDLRTTVDPNLSLLKAWGTSSSDMYFVGRNGCIARKNGSQWTRIESGTDLPIQSIWGGINKITGKEEIICVASVKHLNQGKKVFLIDGNKVTDINTENLPWSLSSIWFIPGLKYYITGDGIFMNYSLTKGWRDDDSPPLLYKHFIYGTALNEIIITGAYGLILYYNGYRYIHLMGDISDYSNNISAMIKGNTIVVVGWKDNQAKIVVGKR